MCILALFSINASKTSYMKGAMVADGGDSCNCAVKVVLLKNKPHLCLFATHDIAPGIELTIAYGNDVVVKQVSILFDHDNLWCSNSTSNIIIKCFMQTIDIIN